MKTYFKNENRYTKLDLISGELVNIFINIPAGPSGDSIPVGPSGDSIPVGPSGDSIDFTRITEFNLSTQLIDISQINALNLQLKTIMNDVTEKEFSDLAISIKEKVNKI
jgi:hypothetical protein